MFDIIYTVGKYENGVFKYNCYRGNDRKRALQVLKDREEFFKGNKNVILYLTKSQKG